MMGEKKTVRAECDACQGTGLYVGMAERDGAAVVCQRCRGTGETAVAYRVFAGRQPVPPTIRRVYVNRGYVVSPDAVQCVGGLPIEAWVPGAPVPANELLYCPYLYTHQAWCAEGQAPLHAGQQIDTCPEWRDKATCWAKYHADPNAPKVTR